MRHLYPSSFKLSLRWLPSFTPVIYWSKLLGINSVAALMHQKQAPLGDSNDFGYDRKTRAFLLT